jgi:hypothetical protein
MKVKIEYPDGAIRIKHGLKNEDECDAYIRALETSNSLPEGTRKEIIADKKKGGGK